MKTILTGGVLPFGLALLLAACGGSSEGGNETAGNETSAGAEAGGNEAAHADEGAVTLSAD